MKHNRKHLHTNLVRDFRELHRQRQPHIDCKTEQLIEFPFRKHFPPLNELFSAADKWVQAFYYRMPAGKEIAAFGSAAKMKGTSMAEFSRFPDVLSGHSFFSCNSGFEKSLPFMTGYIDFPEGPGNTESGHKAAWKMNIPEFLFIQENNEASLLFRAKIKSVEDYTALPDYFQDALKKILLPENDSKRHFPKITEAENKDAAFDVWQERYNIIEKAIAEGKVSKVVLSRFTDSDLDGKPDSGELIRRLNNGFPESTVFGIIEEDRFFFGASPETLLQADNLIVRTDALAGSTARGNNEEEDDNFGSALLSSQKDLDEHQYVVDFIEHSLQKYCIDIERPQNPQLKKLPNIQHLHTPFNAKLKEPEKVFDVITELFPTPAVCGTPREKAIQLILDTEGKKRGTFSGIAGWFDLRFNCDFAVLIRSAGLSGGRLRTYAGCGIVAGSDSKKEFDETAMKMQVINGIFSG